MDWALTTETVFTAKIAKHAKELVFDKSVGI